MQLDEIVETFEFLDDWEDKYRLVIDLGKSVPEMPEPLRVEENLVRGCQSQVWLVARPEGGVLALQMDSDAHIVRGLIAIVLAALDGKSPEEIVHHDTEALFDRLQLIEHLSPTRGNGLVAMLQKIRATARDHMDA